MWHDEGNCKNRYQLHEPQPDETKLQRLDREARAKENCIDCPIWLTCLKEGLRAEAVDIHFAMDGIWAGMNRKELLSYALSA